MSQTKMQKLSIRNRKDEEGKLSKGANMIVELDGVPVRGATFVKFEVKAGGIAKVMIEMFAEVEVEANVELNNEVTSGLGLECQGKAVILKQIGSYLPAKIATKIGK